MTVQEFSATYTETGDGLNTSLTWRNGAPALGLSGLYRSTTVSGTVFGTVCINSPKTVSAAVDPSHDISFGVPTMQVVLDNVTPTSWTLVSADTFLDAQSVPENWCGSGPAPLPLHYDLVNNVTVTPGAATTKETTNSVSGITDSVTITWIY